jgi:hypothetical protein
MQLAKRLPVPVEPLITIALVIAFFLFVALV